MGYNDILIARPLPLPLTSVRTNFEQIATAALELLHDGSDADSWRVAMPTLMPRGSSMRVG